MVLARVGYFEGTDPLLLSKLAAEGVETLPVANTKDGHGKYVTHLGKGEVNVVVGYFHKVVPAEDARMKPADILFACKTWEIPVVLITPTASHDKAVKVLGEVGPTIHIVAPDQVEAEVRKYL